MSTLLAPIFDNWFAGRGWQPHTYQLDMVALSKTGQGALLIAPTGGGKTLAGFLPSLLELNEKPSNSGLHTLYISPLKALSMDVHRNVEKPIAEMGLDITCETRTGDTPAAARQRQRRRPPHILMTTPESLALMLSYADSDKLFKSLRCIILDELHALAGTKRGDLLSLGLARLGRLAPRARRVGLSATVADPPSLQAYLSKTGRSDRADDVTIVKTGDTAEPQIQILEDYQSRLPWSGHMASYAIGDIYKAIKKHNHTIVFVNTRAQAEIIFQALWRENSDNLKIALHHGSLAAEKRRRVEEAMAQGALRAVVATSSLDLGIDWGDVDLVVQVGAPKGASRLLQRIGRAGHTLTTPSKALLVPANRFEVLECRAAMDALRHGWLDDLTRKSGALDVLAQHILGMGCAAPFKPDALYEEITKAAPYADLPRAVFEKCLNYVAHGGYALRVYDQFRKLTLDEDNRFRVASPKIARQYRMNVGTIVEANTLLVRFRRGKKLGQVEEYFIQNLEPGDTFIFSGQLLTFEGLEGNTVIVSKGKGEDPKIPAYAGGRLPLSTSLADQVRTILGKPQMWDALPPDVRQWLEIQQSRSALPGPEGLLVETFRRRHRPRSGRGKARDTHYLVAYCFEGRNAHQTLGMLLTKRMERLGCKPLGFVANDYVLAIWSLEAPEDVAALFTSDILGDELEEWMAESALLRRTFRQVAIVAGMIERKHPGAEKTSRQVTFNSDLIYDVLRKYDPDHILLEATRQEAARGLTDIRRLSDMLNRVENKIDHMALEKVSPLALPVLLEVGREPVYQQGSAMDALLEELEADQDALIEEAMGAV